MIPSWATILEGKGNFNDPTHMWLISNASWLYFWILFNKNELSKISMGFQPSPPVEIIYAQFKNKAWNLNNRPRYWLGKEKD